MPSATVLADQLCVHSSFMPDGVAGLGGMPDSVLYLNKELLVTGGDSGIGRAVVVHFAREKADLAIVYLDEDRDAAETRGLVEREGQRCLLCKGDVGEPDYCKRLVDNVMEEFGALDILVSNAAEQHPAEDITEIDEDQLKQTFNTHIFGYYHI